MEQELDLLGDLLVEALKFLDSGFDADLRLHDETTDSELPAKEMFKETGGRWFLRAESVPGDLAVKAIGIDSDGLYLELAPLDGDRVKEVLVEEMLPFSFDAKHGTFSDVHHHEALVSVSKPVTPEADLDPRCLYTVSLKEVSGARRYAVVKLIDALYGNNCFVVPQEEQAVSVAPVTRRPKHRLELRLGLHLQQRLLVEQRPMLALRPDLQATVQVGLRTDVQTLLILERRLVSMTPDQVADFVSEHVTKYGEARTKNVLLFTIAGQIRRSVPKLSWKKARELARNIAAKAQRSA